MESEPATVLAAATATYRGDLTTPERWSTWVPRKGDILVCTPPKCGTTWTQTMLAMLLHGGRETPERIPILSPWVDAALGDAKEVVRSLERQRGRRVVKSHTPADGFPVWDGVTVVAVYRHPLDIFFSLRKHASNRKGATEHPMRRPLDIALASHLSSELDVEDFDHDTLATVAQHFRATVLAGRIPRLVLLHYADMIADRRGAVRRLAEGTGIKADETLIEEVVNSTGYRGVTRVLGTVEGLKKFVAMRESPYHGLNFCQGTIAEMLADPASEIADVIRWFGGQKKIFNVHFRNIRGHKLSFSEVFPDEGDMDMWASIRPGYW